MAANSQATQGMRLPQPEDFKAHGCKAGAGGQADGAAPPFAHVKAINQSQNKPNGNGNIGAQQPSAAVPHAARPKVPYRALNFVSAATVTSTPTSSTTSTPTLTPASSANSNASTTSTNSTVSKVSSTSSSLTTSAPHGKPPAPGNQRAASKPLLETVPEVQKWSVSESGRAVLSAFKATRLSQTLSNTFSSGSSTSSTTS